MDGETVSEEDLRVGDSERDQTATQLSEHFAAGRLDISEFNERTEQALSARTRGELDLVLSDLPLLPVTVKPSTPDIPSKGVSPQQMAERREWRRSMLTTWAVFAVFFVAIWAMTGAGYFWPMWPILGWGIGVAVSGIKAYSSPDTYKVDNEEHDSLPPSTQNPDTPPRLGRDRP